MSKKEEEFSYSSSSQTKNPIRKPLQDRSRQKMDRIMDVTEQLLAEKPFDRITIAEIARISGAGTSSIYARFKDKNALILGVHERLRDRASQCLDELADPARWEAQSTEDIVREMIIRVIRFYRGHEFLIRAALFLDDIVVRERQAAVLRTAAERFTAIFSGTNLESQTARAINTAVDASIRIVTSVVYSAFMFGGVQLVRKPVSDRELARQLTCAVTALLSEAGSPISNPH